MKVRQIIVYLNGSFVFPRNVDSGIVRKIYRSPYGGFGKPGEWVPVNGGGGIATKAFHQHSFKSAKLDLLAEKHGLDPKRFDCFDVGGKP